MTDPVHHALVDAVGHVFPAGQAVVLSGGDLVCSYAVGQVGTAETTADTLFDIASITKLVATTAALGLLVSERHISFDDPVSLFLPLFARNGKADLTLRELMGHRSGLAPWQPFFTSCQADAIAQQIYPWAPVIPGVSRAVAFERARSLVVDAVLTDPQAQEAGVRAYSDLGFIALGEVVAAVVGQPFDAFCAEHVFARLGAKQTRFFDLRTPPFTAGDIAGTGVTRPREPAPGQEGLFQVPEQLAAMRSGEVDDDNAFAMHGVAGHAGVFSTAMDVARIGQALLEDAFGAEHLMTTGVMHELMSVDTGATGPERGLGFDRISTSGSSAGTRLGQSGRLGGVGHLGFTGTSLWLDLDRKAVVSLVTNRTLLGRELGARIKAFRPQFHNLVASVLDEEPEAEITTDPGVH
jgi:CubicO group peptidase (beta-lactamase class C family)